MAYGGNHSRPGNMVPAPTGGKGFKESSVGKSSFNTNLSNIGTSASSSRIFSGAGITSVSVVDEERRLIDKVFSIVDKDNSGQIDMKELEQMFKLFGVESVVLSNTISRIMKNVDKNFDGNISATEFYELLSQKFERGNPRSEIMNVFDKMDTKKDKQLDVEELHQVAQMLGENIPKTEIKEMIKMFNLDYQAKLKEAKAKKLEKMPDDPTFITPDDFYEIMQFEIPSATNNNMA